MTYCIHIRIYEMHLEEVEGWPILYHLWLAYMDLQNGASHHAALYRVL
jgi:hypothetical protein